MIRRVGILTAGGDSPGLNAAIRGFGKAALGHGMELIGFRDGLKGLVEDRWQKLDGQALAGILTIGGTILGTSRDKPHKMLVDGVTEGVEEVVVARVRARNLERPCFGDVALSSVRVVKDQSLRVRQVGVDVEDVTVGGHGDRFSARVRRHLARIPVVV